jgi:excisionase family DNA binding protein
MSKIGERCHKIPEAARRLSVCTRTVYRLIAMRELPKPIKVLGASRILDSDLEAYMKRRKEARDEHVHV